MNSTDICECCEGVTALTPTRIVNRPGLSALTYRVGTHGAFLETMKARLSSLYWLVRGDDDASKTNKVYPLHGLTTRAADDASIALLDAWATVGDVLTFYQERIANEGYLRTAIERRSVLELARLVGYALRPGVAASVWLALELEKGHTTLIEPYQVRAQNIPGPGQLPQTFENIERFEARAEWNALQPRLTRPQTKLSITSGTDAPRVYLQGVATNLKAGDPLLIDWGDGAAFADRNLYRVTKVDADAAANRTQVTLQLWKGGQQTNTAAMIDQAKTLIARVNAEHAAMQRVPEMRQRTQTYLDALQAHIDGGADEASVREFIERNTLPQVAGELRVAEMNPRYSRLIAWLAELVSELQSVRSVTVDTGSGSTGTGSGNQQSLDELIDVLAPLAKVGSVPPRNALSLDRSLCDAFDTNDIDIIPPERPGARALAMRRTLTAAGRDTSLQVIGAFEPRVRASLPVALANTSVTPSNQIRIYALRAKAAPFAHNAPLRSQITQGTGVVKHFEWQLNDPLGVTDPSSSGGGGPSAALAQGAKALYLDADYAIQSDSIVVIQKPDKSLQFEMPQTADIEHSSLAAYGVSSKTTRIKTAADWIGANATFSNLRQTVVYAQSEVLPLAEEPIADEILGGESDLIELDRLYNGLQSGRWIVVSGERTDIKDVSGNVIPGVVGQELVMLSQVIQAYDKALPGDQTHTFIKLAKQLEYKYLRAKVTFNANVVKATHGETRNEVLGAGDASKAFQAFTLKQPPLTYVSSPTPAGAQSTLKVYVNDVQWHQADSLQDKVKADHTFITQTADDGKTTIIFGDGKHGARLPTSLENVKAVYRNGIGQLGNVDEGAISLLMTRPLGVKGVSNPLRSSGGADKESRDQARRNAPLSVMALDRLVSVQDYADFAATFAGIGKASAAQMSDGRRQLVHVTVAGAQDIPIDDTSDLFRNLRQALRDFGDPYVPITLAVRELVMLVLSARVRILPEYLWEPVTQKIRDRLYASFGFDQRNLAEDAHLSKVIGVMQSVPGVAYVDVETFGGVEEKQTVNGERVLRTPKQISAAVKKLIDDQAGKPAQSIAPSLTPQRSLGAHVADGTIAPATLIFLPPSVPDVLVINQIK